MCSCSTGSTVPIPTKDFPGLTRIVLLTLSGLLPLFTPANTNHWSASVVFKLIPTLVALATDWSLALIQFSPEPVEDNTCPESPISPLVSLIPPGILTCPLIPPSNETAP